MPEQNPDIEEVLRARRSQHIPELHQILAEQRRQFHMILTAIILVGIGLGLLWKLTHDISLQRHIAKIEAKLELIDRHVLELAD